MAAPGPATITQTINTDHANIEKWYNEVLNSADAKTQQRFGNQFTWELARHSVAEELLVYPAFEKYLGAKGREMAESDRKQHHRIKEHLKEFQNMNAQDPNYVPKLKELGKFLFDHMKEEEKDDVPALEATLDRQTSETLAKNFNRSKHFIPSRSHPSAGENPAFESVMGLLTAPMDKLADMFRKFPDSDQMLEAQWGGEAKK